MRPKARILRIMVKLYEIWRANPDLRFTQLVYNIISMKKHLPPSPQLFYIEDNEVEEAIDSFKEWEKANNAG